MQLQPLCRSNHTSSVVNNNLIVFGGENEASKVTNNLTEYLIDSKQWKNYDAKQFDQIPTERAGHSMIKSYNNNIYIFGGDAGPQSGRLNDLWKLDLNKITEKDAFQYMNTLGEAPVKRMKHSSTIYNSYMFIFGGCDDQNYNENDKNNKNDNPFNKLYVINMNTNDNNNDKIPLTWYKISIPNLPQRIRHTMHVLNTIENNNYFQISLVIICGEDKNAYLQNDIFILQCKGQINSDNNKEEKKQNELSENKNIFECLINNNNWSVIKINGIPFRFAPRFGHSSVVLPFINNDNNEIVLRNIIVFGGYSGEMSVLNDLWLISMEINIKNGLYKLKECKLLGVKGLPSPRHGHSLNIINNKLIIYGGINLMFETFNDVISLDINLKQWQQMKEIQQKQKGMSENEMKIAKQQLKNMGFSDDMIDNALVNARNFDDALGISVQKETYFDKLYNCNVYAHQGYQRRQMQDTYKVCLAIPNHPEYALFGVFDGFNGDYAASYLSENILNTMNKLSDLNDDRVIINAIHNMDIQWLAQNIDNNAGSTFVFAIIKAINSKSEITQISNIKPLDSLNSNIATPIKTMPKLQNCPSLSYQVTIASEILSPTDFENNILLNMNNSTSASYQSLPTQLSPSEIDENHDFEVRIFWAGDSRAIAIEKETDFKSLTVDHNCNVETETKRIVNANGEIKNDRIDGIVAVSRAFGCHVMKNNKRLPQNKQKMISIAECKHIICKQNERLMIFCDGLIAPHWNNETIVKKYNNILKEHKNDKDLNLDSLIYLTDQAMDEGSTDNITTILIQLQ